MKILSFDDLKPVKGIAYGKLNLWRMESVASFPDAFLWDRAVMAGSNTRLTLGLKGASAPVMKPQHNMNTKTFPRRRNPVTRVARCRAKHKDLCCGKQKQIGPTCGSR